MTWRVVVLGGGGVSSRFCVPTYFPTYVVCAERRARCGRCVRESGGAAGRYVMYRYVIYYVPGVFPVGACKPRFRRIASGTFSDRATGDMVVVVRGKQVFTYR